MTIANIHASCILLNRAGDAFGAPRDAGILLLGKSGAGKSDLALRMIEGGARLVADDRVELSVREGLLIARAPPRLTGLIEVRGAGILALPYAAEARVALAVLLETRNPGRMPDSEFYVPPLADAPRKIPLLRLSAFEASSPAKIAAASAAFARGLFREQAHPD